MQKDIYFHQPVGGKLVAQGQFDNQFNKCAVMCLLKNSMVFSQSRWIDCC